MLIIKSCIINNYHVRFDNDPLCKVNQFHHVWHMPALTEIFGDDACLQFGGGTLGHPWGNAVWIQ